MAPVAPLRAVHLISDDLWAGAEVATFHLVRALALRPELDVSVVALNHGELSRRLEAEGVRVRVEPESGRSFPELVRAVRGGLANADLVHAHRYKESLLAALSGRPWLATQHGRPEPFHGLAALRMRTYLALDLLAKRLAARRVIAVSGEIESWLATRVGAARTVRAWNGIADPLAGRDPAGWASRGPVVGAVARLVPVKGLELAIDAVAACPEVRLEIVGDGPERAALEARARTSGAGDRVRFLGFDPQPTRHMERWRALVLSSHHEGNPICALEAIALGTPIVAGPLPGVAEILGGEGGLLQAGRDPAQWAAALRRLVGDAELGGRLSRAVRARFLEAFTAEAAAARVEGVYRAALAAG